MIRLNRSLRVNILGESLKAQWLSWLERRPVTAEVGGSSPPWVVLFSESYESSEKTTIFM